MNKKKLAKSVVGIALIVSVAILIGKRSIGGTLVDLPIFLDN